MMNGVVEPEAARMSTKDAEGLKQKSQDLLTKLQRDMNILAESTSDRSAKRRALEKIGKELKLEEDLRVSLETFKLLIRPLLRCLSDSVEKCRELGSVIIQGYSEKMGESSASILPYILPVLTDRLAQQEILEPAEEIRLVLVQILVTLVTQCQEKFAPFVDDAVKILAKTLADPYQEVRKTSCQMVIQLAKANSRPLAFHGAAVPKSILPCLVHRHSSVRIAGILAMKEALIVEIQGLDDVIEPLRALTFDKTPAVREALHSTAGEWLLKLPDRYSIGYKILPLLLAGLSDDMPQLAAKSLNDMNEAGKLYEQEWEDRVKDEMDYTDGRDTLSECRPRVGCRHLARDNTQKVVNKMIEGLADWTADKRAKSAQILASFLIYTEDKITGYVASILGALYKIMAGDEPHVMNEVIQLCTVLGKFVVPDVYSEHLIPQLKTGGGGALQFRIGALRVYAALLSGSITAKAITTDHMQMISEALLDRDLMTSESIPLLLELAKLASTLMTSPSGLLKVEDKASYNYFLILSFLLSTDGETNTPSYPELINATRKALDALTAQLSLTSTQSLFALYIDQILLLVSDSIPTWTRYSPERLLLNTLLVESGPIAGQKLELILPVFRVLSAPDVEFEIKEGLFLLVNELMERHEQTLNSTAALHLFSEPLLEHVILNNIVWNPGRKAMAIRDLAVSFLLQLLQKPATSPENLGLLQLRVLQSIFEKKLLPHVTSALEEDILRARKSSLLILDILFASPLEIEAPNIKIVYPELIKRFDDAQDDIRILTAKVFITFFNSIARWQARMKPLVESTTEGSSTVKDDTCEGGFREIKLDDVHWEAIVKGITIHLDDMNSALQEACCETLKVAKNVVPLEIVREHLNSVRSRHRTSQYIDAIMSV